MSKNYGLTSFPDSGRRSLQGAGHTIGFWSRKDAILPFFRKYRRDPAALGESPLRTETDYARLCGVKLTFDIQAR